MNDRPRESRPVEPAVDSGPLMRIRFSFRTLLRGIAVIGVIYALCVTELRSPMTTAYRAQCVNNLKQIALALHQYQEKYGSLPPAYIAAEDGTPLHSWRVLILPFMDHQDLYDQYRFDEPWDGPNNRKLADRTPTIYRCPKLENVRRSFWRSDSKTDDSLTSYVVLAGDETPFPGSRATKLEEIRDGTSYTLMVVELERESAVPWHAPQDIAPAGFARVLIDGNIDRLPHPDGVHAAFADGSVRFLKKSIDRDLLRKISTANDGEPFVLREPEW